MPRILFIAERFAPDIGGLATSGARIARTLASIGFEVDVVAWSRHVSSGRMQTQPIDEPRLRVFRVGQYRQWDMTMPATLNMLEWLHNKEAYDLVWGHYLFPAGFLATWFGKMRMVPSVVSARGNDIDREIFPPGDFSRLGWTLQNATGITAASKDLANKIGLLSGRHDVITLPNVVDASIFAPPSSQAERESIFSMKKRLEICEDELVLGFSGELREKKGMQFLLEALSATRRKQKACLLIIGEVRAQQKPALQLYAAEFPEDNERIIITGHIAEPHMVAEHLRLCDVYLQPSLFEGMPNALLEAMSTERVCIASDAGGIPEIVKHTMNGFIVNRAELNHLWLAINEVLSLSAEEKASIATNARQTILREFASAHEQNYLRDITASVLSKP